ncbi:MAG: cell division protein FtsA [Candidatus Yanofskybacteria bacterium RIFCSPHIGHO2_01_FULL_42_12]|uniref:Cell division protein FtsA n=1 Tax=Candidatus Yanofskybacteria bacterium RIFCSPLOWO2_01_FULL_42_49 TaxID=1802694 RepID=A0A1F8GDP2_9BACT|nr:MAG: cell division protein FtsA [Candidatus Yanofskybacteria bacterium RIFCSPHIGHO2_01_FULL_42_12]OGN23505.1 MAG: cell division protein FtsA [Candidatus Yanofskybacteria bacterium RIFCSPLOWO2_01_FULL_42_49]
MARPYLISGIDIGNSQVKVVVARINSGSLRPEILGTGSAESEGLRRGMVVDMEETIDNIKSAIQKAEAMAGVQIKKTYVGINGLHIKTQVSRGVIAVSRADNEISQNDIDRVIQAASVVSMPANREIIHVIPRNFVVDGTEYVKNPLGMKGVRLEADALIIDGLSPYLRNIAKCVNENGIEVSGLVYAPLAASLSSLNKSQREHGVINLDFGGGTSTLAVFEEADLIHSAVIPIGSKHITNDLAVALRTSLNIAERIKLEHCSTSNLEDLRKRDNIDLSQIIGEENFVVPKKQLVKVVDARIGELLDIVESELKKVSKNGILPAGVVLSGGGSNLPGFAFLVKDRLRLPVRVAEPLGFDGANNIVGDPSFSVSVGLVLWGIDKELGGQKQKLLPEANGAISKITDWLKNFLP